MQTWTSCQVKAGFEYIAGYEDPGNVDTAFGGEVHAALEAYKKDGTPLDLMTEVGAVAAEALPYVEHFRAPRDGGTARFEGDFKFHSGRHAWRGAIDIAEPGRIVDYKTTSDFKWAKTSEALMHDPQAVLYAARELMLYPELPSVELTWLYLRKRRPYKAHPVVVTMTRAHALRAFSALEDMAQEFQDVAAKAPVLLTERHRYVLDVLTPNYNHCTAYRGCPHIDRCPRPFFIDPNNQPPQPRTTMDLLARLQEMDRIAAAGGNPLSPPALVVTAPAAPSTRTETMRGEPVPPLLAALAGNPFVTAPAPAPAPAPAAVSSPSSPFAPGGAFEGLPETASPAPDAPANEVPATFAPVAPGQINPPARGRGRPPGSKNKPKEAVPTVRDISTDPHVAYQKLVALDAEAARLDPPTIPAPAPAPVKDGPHRLECLFVGCHVVANGGPATDYIADFDALVAMAKVAIGPAAYFAAYGYKANGMLLQMIEGIVQQVRPISIRVTHPNSPEALLCLSYLRSIADTLVESVR